MRIEINCEVLKETDSSAWVIVDVRVSGREAD